VKGAPFPKDAQDTTRYQANVEWQSRNEARVFIWFHLEGSQICLSLS